MEYSPWVICGFPGIGKSRVAHDRLSISDSDSSAYSLIWDEREPWKMVRNQDFPGNYVDVIENAVKGIEYEYILVSTHKIVREELKRRGIKYIIVAPKPHLKSEYLARYLKRGSTMEFIERMNAEWDDFIGSIIADDAPIIWLESGQYLSDVIGVM